MSSRPLLVLGIAAAAGVAVLAFAPLDAFFPRSASQTLLVSGNIEAHQSVLSFKVVQSRIAELPFDEGQWVDAGTLLARLDDADYRQQVVVDATALRVQQRQLTATQQTLEATRKTVVSDAADVAQKSLNLTRTEKLWRQGIAATEQHDLAETAIKQSQAAYLRDQAMVRAAEGNLAVATANVRYAREKLKLSKMVLGYTVLRAPFAGVILVRQAELGEVMLPGTPVVMLADVDHVWLRAYVQETDLGRIRWGQAATIHTDTYPDRRYAGRISFISSQAEFTPKSVETHAERVTLVYRIRIDVENPAHELKPGMPADATIDLAPTGAHG